MCVENPLLRGQSVRGSRRVEHPHIKNVASDRLRPQNPPALMSRRAQSVRFAPRMWRGVPFSGWSSGSVATLWHVSESKAAKKSRTSSWRIAMHPPLQQVSACSKENCWPQAQVVGIFDGSSHSADIGHHKIPVVSDQSRGWPEAGPWAMSRYRALLPSACKRGCGVTSKSFTKHVSFLLHTGVHHFTVVLDGVPLISERFSEGLARRLRSVICLLIYQSAWSTMTKSVVRCFS